MLAFDTPFRAQVRALKSPSSRDFDASAWRALLEAQDLTAGDLALGTMAMWVAAQSESFRGHVDKRPQPPIGAQTATILAVAVLNHEHAVLSDKLLKAQKAARETGTMSMDQLANQPIASRDGLFEVDAGSHMDAATDVVDSWIYDAAGYPDEGNVPAELGSVAAQHMTRFSMQRGHYDLWQQALWEDWRLTSLDSRLVFVPADPDLAALQDAWLLRKQSNFMELVWLDMSTWPLMSQEARRARQLPMTVIRVEARKSMRRKFVVARPPIKRMSAYAVACSGLEGSYLASFLVRPLPKYPDFTCEVLLRAWHVLNDLAQALAAARPRATFDDMESVHRWALVVRRNELVGALCRALSLTEEFASRVVEFLSWARGVYKGLWGAPLVPLPGAPDRLAIAASVLSTANVIRTVEIWMTKGGLDDKLSQGARGKSFEAELRADIREALLENSVVRNTACAEYAVKKGPDFAEEIDLLVRFDSLLLVGEVKCFLFPTDARERYNFLKKLKAACAQASRKARAIAGRSDISAKALGISEAAVKQLRVLPITVLNQGFGVSLIVDDCVVVDAKFLKLYLSTGTYVSEGGANHVAGGWAEATRSLYRSASEATANFESAMHRPAPLYRFRELLRWSSFSFPTASKEPLLIAQTVVGQLSEETRARYEMLSTLVAN